MPGQKAAPKKRRGPQTKSTTRIVTHAEARALAQKWRLSGEERDEFIWWLPAVTEMRRAVEAEFKAAPTAKKLIKDLSAAKKHLTAISQVFKRHGWMEALSAGADGRVVEWVHDIDELMLPFVQVQLRELNHQAAGDGGRVGNRSRPQDLKLAESAVDFHAAHLSRIKLSRAKFVRGCLTEAGVAEGLIDDLIKKAGKPGGE